MINKIKFKNYKLFKQKQTFDLRPITILIGKNNTGKSAILKLPVLISSCLSGEPLNWKYQIGTDSSNFVVLGSDFKDLIYNKHEYGLLEFEALSEINSINFTINKEYGVLDFIINSKEVELSENTKRIVLDPDLLEDLSLNIDYLGALRITPESNYSNSTDKIDKIGVDGKNAYPLLIQDFLYDGDLIKKVGDWYKNNFENWSIGVLESKFSTETKYEIAIFNSQIKAININQAGQGIHQVLPLITRSFIKVEEQTLIIIEEPETHLHPAAHGNLAERFVDSYTEDNNRNYLIETHSQNFVLRLRRMVAEGKLKKEDFAIYYVDFDENQNEGDLREIKVNDTGGVEWWPSGVFSETSTETRAIYNAQLNDLKNVD